MTSFAGKNVLITGSAGGIGRLMALKAFAADGDGTLSDAIECIDYARAKGAQVINASWGADYFTSEALLDAIASAREAGIIFSAAAGNASSKRPRRQCRHSATPTPATAAMPAGQPRPSSKSR